MITETLRRHGSARVAHVGTKPIKSEATLVANPRDLDEWIRGADADWTVASTPAEYSFGGKRIQIDDRRILHRSDDGMPLGIVSSDYKIVQPRDVVEFYRDLIEGAGFELDTVGTLFGGRKFWAMGYIGEAAVADKRDVVRGYLLLHSTLDGSGSTIADFVTKRLACTNMLRALLREASAGVRIPHSTTFDATDVKKRLGIAPKRFGESMELLRRLANTPVPESAALALTSDLLDADIDDDKLDGRVGNRILELFAGASMGADLKGVAGTGWGWLNAVTQFVDHEKRAKSDSHQLNTLLFGSGDRLKTRALDLVSAI